MKAIDKKLLRDLRRLKGQVFTIALVGASGIAAFIALQSTWRSLDNARAEYYQSLRFSDVFARLELAPNRVAADIASIPGVLQVYPRVVESVMLPMADMLEPAIGRIISLPHGEQPPQNQLHLRAGRLTRPGADHEVVLLDSFAQAHGLGLGDSLPAVINGRLRQLQIVGLALSPEFVFAVSPGEFAADDERFAVMWMDHEAVAAAFGMEGAFNDLSLMLQTDAHRPTVLRQVDAILAPFGGLGAVPRQEQASNKVLQGELSQIRQFATMVPSIFLAVAAFLLNVVLSRLVFLQRQQIAALKALGYGGLEIGWHYFKLVGAIVVFGSIVGVMLGAYLGQALTGLYGRFFHFPNLSFVLRPELFVVALMVGLLPGVIGGLASVRRIVKLPAAQAMQPPTPARYRVSVIDRWARRLGSTTLMIARELRRHPWRTMLSALGIGASIGVVVIGRFGQDSFRYLLNDVLLASQKSDITVSFSQPLPERAVRSLAHEPGVLQVEGIRAVPVRLRAGSIYRDASIMGLADRPRLRLLVERSGRELALPPTGIALSLKLAEVLGVSVGDRLLAEVKEGQWQTVSVTITALVDDAFGLQAYMRRTALMELLQESPVVSAVEIRTDPLWVDALHERLKEMPNVIRVERRDVLVQRFEEQSGETMTIITLVLSAFAATIAVGVVYNNARVALSLRSRDLASLRVLGFTRQEVSAILLGELLAQVVIAIPIGLLFGRVWSEAVMGTVDPEVYRLPLVISTQTYVLAVGVAVFAGLASALLVRRRLDHMDLIAVLKTRE